ncbi:hypothetical protein M378DRAFT_10030 [Amanita muscaria Koide BX008]|uniref:Uncharacterized protein n=1 Tax=Amanita muscaria (strain Koide BX008) TaxID=946122 RepID=A0A0C2STH4_AMAMK|nr:hypothetical protein M378DRAFT_10030 [Amanita muscaria Koide BX008]
MATFCRRFVDELISPRGGGELKHEAQAWEEEAIAVQQEQQNDSRFAEAETASGNLKKEKDHLNQTKLDDVTPLPEETRRLLEQRQKMMYQIFYTNRVVAACSGVNERGIFDCVVSRPGAWNSQARARLLLTTLIVVFPSVPGCFVDFSPT